MTEYARKQQHGPARTTGDSEDTEARDLRNPELDEDIACCLGEIDEALDRDKAEREQAQQEFAALAARDKAEREQALREFIKFDWMTSDFRLNQWQAQYAHLGLKYGRSCCGAPYLLEPDGDK